MSTRSISPKAVSPKAESKLNKSVLVPSKSTKLLDTTARTIENIRQLEKTEKQYLNAIKEVKKGHVSPYKRDRKFEKEYLK